MYNRGIRKILSIVWIVLGAVLLGLSAAGKLDSSIYAGLGGALIAVGALQTIRHLRYGRDEEYKEKSDIAESDERNRFIRMKSWSWTGYIVVLANGIGVIIAMILGKETIQQVLLYSICLIVVVYWVTYMVISRKY